MDITTLLTDTMHDQDGGSFDWNTVIEEAQAVQSKDAKTKLEKGNLDAHMVLTAQHAGSYDMFKELTDRTQEVHKWGNPPKGTPKEQRTLYSAAPETYTQYKSKILAAMKSGIVPCSEFTFVTKLKEPDVNGNTEKHVKTELNSVSSLVKARQQVEKEKNTDENGNAILMDEDGIPDISYTMLMADIKVITDTFRNMDEATKKAIGKRVHSIAAALNKAQATIDKAQDKATEQVSEAATKAA